MVLTSVLLVQLGPKEYPLFQKCTFWVQPPITYIQFIVMGKLILSGMFSPDMWGPCTTKWCIFIAFSQRMSNVTMPLCLPTHPLCMSIVFCSLISLYYGFTFCCAFMYSLTVEELQYNLWLCEIIYFPKPWAGTSVLKIKCSIIQTNWQQCQLKPIIFHEPSMMLLLGHKTLSGVTFEEYEKDVWKHYFTSKLYFVLCLGNPIV